MPKTKSKREAGDDFAERMCAYLNIRTGNLNNPLLITKNSGATHRDGDFKNNTSIFDCKESMGKALPASIKSEEIKKVNDQAILHSRDGFLIVNTRHGIMVACTLETFTGLWAHYMYSLNDKTKKLGV